MLESEGIFLKLYKVHFLMLIEIFFSPFNSEKISFYCSLYRNNKAEGWLVRYGLE